MSTTEIDHAVRYLRDHGCERVSGRWMQGGGVVLASDPVESARLLRHMLIRAEIDRTRAAGGWSHR